MKKSLGAHSAMFAVVMLIGCGDRNQGETSAQSRHAATTPPAQLLERFEAVTLKLTSPAIGHVDGINDVTSPQAGSTVIVSGDKIAITGNYVDALKGEAAAGVVAMIGGKPYATVYGGERPDIAKALNNPKYLKIQFYAEVPTSIVGTGLHDIRIRAIAADRSGYFESDWFATLNVK